MCLDAEDGIELPLFTLGSVETILPILVRVLRPSLSRHSAAAPAWPPYRRRKMWGWLLIIVTICAGFMKEQASRHTDERILV